MTTITKFTAKNVGSIQAQIVAACEAAGITGVSFTGATRSYGATETTFKIIAKVEGTTSRADQDLIDACYVHEIDLAKKGRNGETLIEYHARKHTYPFIFTTTDGGRRKTDARGWKNLVAA